MGFLILDFLHGYPQLFQVKLSREIVPLKGLNLMRFLILNFLHGYLQFIQVKHYREIVPLKGLDSSEQPNGQAPNQTPTAMGQIL